MKKNLLLIVILAALVAAAVVLLRKQGGVTTGDGVQEGDKVLPEFDLTKIARIEVQSGDETNIVENADGDWVLRNLHGFPVKADRLRDEVVKLAELEVGQTVRGGTEMLDDFELDAGKGRIVRLLDAAGGELASVHLGKERTSGEGGQFGPRADGQYLRVGDGPVMLVQDAVTGFDNVDSAWVEKEIVNVSKAKVKEVTVTLTNATYLLSPAGDNDYYLDVLKQGQAIDNSKAYSVLNALSYLSFNEVVPADTPAADTGLDQPQTYVARTEDNLVYTVKVGRRSDDGDYAIQISAAADGIEPPERASAEALVPPVEGEENQATRNKQVDEKFEEMMSEHTNAVATAMKAAEEFNAKKSKWIYAISSYKGEAFIKPLGELVKEVEKEEDGDEAGGKDETSSLGPSVENLGEAVKAAASNTVESVKDVSGAVDEVRKAATDAALDAGTKAVDTAVDTAVDAGKAAADAAADAGKAAVDAGKAAVDKVKNIGGGGKAPEPPVEK